MKTATKTDSQTMAKPRVAVAEDDPVLRSAVVAARHEAGFAVTPAHDGRELLELLQSVSPGYFRLVLTEQRLPRIAGLECLALAGARAPFVLVTGEDDPALHAAAAKFGAAAVMRKPVELTAVVALATQIIRRNLDEPGAMGGAAS